MKAVLGVSLVAAVAAGVLWLSGGEPSTRAQGEVTAPRQPSAARAGTSPPTRTKRAKAPWEGDADWSVRQEKREAMRVRIYDALALDEAEEVQPKRYEIPSVDMSVSVGQAVAGCAELLDEDEHGRVSLSFHYLGAPGIGVIVDEVTVDTDGLEHPEFTECLVASAALAELDPADRPLDGSFRAHYTAGEKPNNLLLFVKANPEIGDEYEAFAELLARGEEGLDDALATGLAETIDGDPELAKQFERWIIEDGIELSVFRPE